MDAALSWSVRREKRLGRQIQAEPQNEQLKRAEIAMMMLSLGLNFVLLSMGVYVLWWLFGDRVGLK